MCIRDSCQVGDNTQNKNALSYGKPIIGKYDYGMIVEEIPSYNIEILCRINKHSANIGIQSRETKTSQYYVTAGVSIGRELDNPYVGIYGAGIKKYYFGQFAFLLGYKYDYQKNGEAVWPTGNHLLSITTGLEVALSANVYFGTMVDLRAVSYTHLTLPTILRV